MFRYLIYIFGGWDKEPTNPSLFSTCRDFAMLKEGEHLPTSASILCRHI